jgi:hypothetical protein
MTLPPKRRLSYRRWWDILSFSRLIMAGVPGMAGNLGTETSFLERTLWNETGVARVLKGIAEGYAPGHKLKLSLEVTNLRPGRHSGRL